MQWLREAGRSGSFWTYIRAFSACSLIGLLISIAWSGLTGHSGDFAYVTTVGWHADALIGDIRFAGLSIACVLVATFPFAFALPRRAGWITVSAFLGPAVGMPLLGRLVPHIDTAPNYYFTVYVIGGVLAGGVASLLSAGALAVLSARREASAVEHR